MSLHTNLKTAIEAARLHPSNRQHLDAGRSLGVPAKLKHLSARLGLAEFLHETESGLLISVDRNRIWTGTAKDWKERGFSPFGYHFVRGIKDSIARNPIISPDTTLKLSEDPQKDMLFCNYIYMWGNEKLLSLLEGEGGNIQNVQDGLVFLEKLRQSGFAVPHGIYETKNRQTEDDFSPYISYSPLKRYAPDLALGENDDAALKNDMLAAFPEHADSLSAIEPLTFNRILGAQMGARFRNFMSRIDDAVNHYANKYQELTWEDVAVLQEKPQVGEQADTPLSRLQAQLAVFDAIRTGLDKKDREQRESLLSRSLDTVDRSGYRWRKDDAECNADKLADAFGISAVQFGASVNDVNERGQFLTLAYDALMDLAHAMNFQPEEAGLPVYNPLSDEYVGLGLAFGSQGRSNSLANYFPSEHFMHFNRRYENGSFVHEWAHGVDRLLFMRAVEHNIITADDIQRIYPDGIGNAQGKFSDCAHYAVTREQGEFAARLTEFNPHWMHLAKDLWQQRKRDYAADSPRMREWGTDDSVFDHADLHLHTASGLLKSHYRQLAGFCASIPANIMLTVETVQTMLENGKDTEKFMRRCQTNLAAQAGAVRFLLPDGHPALDFYGKDFLDNAVNPQKVAELYDALAEGLETMAEKVFNPDTIAGLSATYDTFIGSLGEYVKQTFWEQNPDVKTQIGELIDRHSQNGLVDFEALRADTGVFGGVMNKIAVQGAEVLKHTALFQDVHKWAQAHWQELCGFSAPALAHSLNKVLTDDLAREIHQQAYRKGLGVSYAQSVSDVVRTSELVDSLDFHGQRYFSKPTEIFARVMESAVAVKMAEKGMKNTFLNEIESHRPIGKHFLRGYGDTFGYDVYPKDEEAAVFAQTVKSGLGLTFGTVKLDVKELEWVEEQYSRPLEAETSSLRLG